MVNMLVAHALSFDNISKIIALTSAENIPSVNVLTSCGFNAVAAFEGKDEGNLRFEYLNRNLGEVALIRVYLKTLLSIY
jgi:[ribosomal protein S5]-alanine N-acetyltransferase